MDKDIAEILITEKEISEKISELAKRISDEYKGKSPVFVSVLKGSVLFLSDLLKKVTIPCSLDFISLSSYIGKTESSGIVRLIMDLRESPEGKNLLIVEDIIDTGLTMDYLCKNLLTRRPASLKICTLLDKIESRKVNIKIDYWGFQIPNKFVVGFGLDYRERYRNLPYIGILKKEVYRSDIV